MHSYSSYIGGLDVPSEAWVYTIRSSALLNDFKLKLKWERVHEEVLRRRDDFIEVLTAKGHPRRLAEREIAGVLQGTPPETLKLWRRQPREEHRISPGQLALMRMPDGMVVLSPPQNAAASNSILGLPAMVAGNSLVVKAPRSSPYGVIFAWRRIVAPILAELGAAIPLMELESSGNPSIGLYRTAGGAGLVIPAVHGGGGATAVDAVRVTRGELDWPAP